MKMFIFDLNLKVHSREKEEMDVNFQSMLYCIFKIKSFTFK